MGKFFLGILWLAGFVYIGYVLTARSFAFLEEPGFGLGQDSPLTQFMQLDTQSLKEKLPQDGESPQSWYASLAPSTQSCLRKAVGEESFQDALAGKEISPSPAQMLAVTACLK